MLCLHDLSLLIYSEILIVVFRLRLGFVNNRGYGLVIKLFGGCFETGQFGDESPQIVLQREHLLAFVEVS